MGWWEGFQLALRSDLHNVSISRISLLLVTLLFILLVNSTTSLETGGGSLLDAIWQLSQGHSDPNGTFLLLVWRGAQEIQTLREGSS